MVEDVVAHWLEMWWLFGWKCGGSLVEDVVAHYWKCGGSLVGDVVAHGWKYGGSLVGDVVALWLEM